MKDKESRRLAFMEAENIVQSTLAEGHAALKVGRSLRERLSQPTRKASGHNEPRTVKEPDD